jgi:hypothetical protein
MHQLIVTVFLTGAMDLPPPATSDTQVPCTVWGNTKADTAGVVQVVLSPDHDGKGPEGFDGYPVMVKLADNRARTCRFGGKLKLADRMLAVYEIVTETRTENCLLLVDLGRKAVLHDRKGTCGKNLCNGLVLDNLTFPSDPKTKTCTARRQ